MAQEHYSDKAQDVQKIKDQVRAEFPNVSAEVIDKLVDDYVYGFIAAAVMDKVAEILGE